MYYLRVSHQTNKQTNSYRYPKCIDARTGIFPFQTCELYLTNIYFDVVDDDYLSF